MLENASKLTKLRLRLGQTDPGRALKMFHQTPSHATTGDLPQAPDRGANGAPPDPCRFTPKTSVSPKGIGGAAVCFCYVSVYPNNSIGDNSGCARTIFSIPI